MDVIIYHNPACGTSRNVLAMIRNSGVEPHVIEYLKCPPTRLLLTQLLARAGLTVRQILREKGTPFHELGLGDPSLPDDKLLDAIEAHPILMNRPLVVTPKGVRLCRWRRSKIEPDNLSSPARRPEKRRCSRQKTSLRRTRLEMDHIRSLLSAGCCFTRNIPIRRNRLR